MVITIIILIILATITMNLAFGENGLITKAQLAKEQYEIEQVREKLEMAKGSAFADGKGSIDPDHYFDIIEDEGIIGSKENDVKDNEDGTYEVTTNEGYIFEITLVPTKENPEDIEIDYIGKGESTRPRISTIDVTGKTTNSISVKVEGKNLDGAEYTYYYKKSSEGEEGWKEYSADKSSNTCTISGLETKVVYDIKVVVTTSKGTDEKEISEITGELAEGSIIIGNTEWQGDGTAKVTVTTDITEPGCYIEYKVGADGSWARIESGEEVTLQLNDEIYVRVTDGTNTLAEAYRKIEDKTLPIINKIETSNITSNSITVTVTASDNESGLATSGTYKYYLNNGSPVTSTSNSYQFTGLTAGINYTIKVEVFDKAGNSTTATSNAKTNAVPGVPTVTFKSKTTNSITVQAKATDADGGSLTYTLYTSTSSSGNYKKAATATGTSGNNVSLTASGLNQYTTYYYYVIVTDQISNNQSAKANQRTYCPGTGHTGTVCPGSTTTTVTCEQCGGSGEVCLWCGGPVTVDVEWDGWSQYYAYICVNRCWASGYEGVTEGGDCPLCDGEGEYTKTTNCSHGYSSSHYYCTTHNYVGTVSNHCVHGKTSQHDK